MNKISVPDKEKCRELIDILWQKDMSYVTAIDTVQYWFIEMCKEKSDAGK